MKYESTRNLFWTIVWGVVLIAAIVGIFWKPAVYAVAVTAAVFFGVFLREFIRYARMK